MNKKIVIIGAGMAGCFMGICLAKKGFAIEIYEDRPDVRRKSYDSGRSFNLTLYYRGILAMKKMGIWEDVKKNAVLAEGNVAHYANNKSVFDKFDAHGTEVLYTIHRNQLNSTLLDLVEKYPNVKLIFDTKCIEIDEPSKTVIFEKTNGKVKVHAGIVIGADGVNSIVRQQMEKYVDSTLSQDYEDWGYEEVHVDEEKAEILGLRKLSTHTWPREDSLLIAFPNPDKSYTLMFNLPLEGQNSFAYLNNEQLIKNYIATNFPDLLPLLLEIKDSILNKPTGKFVTIKTSPWYYKEYIVLIGDSAHGVIPFFGQGVSAAFDDCLTISDLIETNKDNWEKMFEAYQKNRKNNTDLLAKLSKENFIELRDKSRSVYYTLKDKSDTLLHRIFPSLWLPPLYVLIAHGTLPYTEAVKKRQKQEKIAKKSGFNLILHMAAFPFEVFKKITGL